MRTIKKLQLKWVCLKNGGLSRGTPNHSRSVFFEKESNPQMKKSLNVAKHQNPLVKNHSLAINYGSQQFCDENIASSSIIPCLETVGSPKLEIKSQCDSVWCVFSITNRLFWSQRMLPRRLLFTCQVFNTILLQIWETLAGLYDPNSLYSQNIPKHSCSPLEVHSRVLIVHGWYIIPRLFLDILIGQEHVLDTEGSPWTWG